MKTDEFKFGQLVTINNIVYRCQKIRYWCGCWDCDIDTDCGSGVISAKQYRKICARCKEYYKNFKRVNYARKY